MEPKGSSPHSQVPTTCPILSQVNPVQFSTTFSRKKYASYGPENIILSHILKKCICPLYESLIYGRPKCLWFETSSIYIYIYIYLQKQLTISYFRILFSLLYAFFWVIPRRLNFICQSFGTLCLFHLHSGVGMKNDWGWECWGIYMGKGMARK